MMYRKQTNKTALQSQNMIVDALFRLLQRKSFQQVTVTELCEEAAVGRKTFYRNFAWKEDVVDFWLDLLCAEYERELDGLEAEQMLRFHLMFLKQYAERLILLYHNGLHPLVNRKFSVFLPRTMPVWSDDPVEQEYRSRYIAAGIEAVVTVWVTREFRESVEQVVEIAQRAAGGQIPLR